ncbi:MAG: SDR family NAD(P)-dependent oxidoreductase [Chloroflexota bacterium]
MAEILKAKVAVITGGTRGLGLAIAQVYAREGASVVVASRSAASVTAAVRQLNEQGGRATGAACDVADLAQVEAIARLAIETFGGLDIWVNNAGISAAYGPTAHIPVEHFAGTIETNIYGTYHGSMVALRRFLPQKRGKLINLLGRGDREPVAMQNGYASSKAWVRNFTLALAKEYRGSGVGVFAFNPGLVKTEMLSQVHALSGYEAKVRPLEAVARMWGHRPDVPAKKALWLASAATDGKTGLEVNVLTPVVFWRGLLREAFSRLTGRVPDDMKVQVHTVQPTLKVDF